MRSSNPSTHTAKRPYAGTHSQNQSSITTYFNAPPSQSPSSPRHNSTPSSTPTLVPQLPHSIQSNLLSVGMRIRKSVPEGYKTGLSYSAFELFSENPSKSTSTRQDYNSGANNSQVNKPSYMATESGLGLSYKGANELAPFCGIMRVGGMSVQNMGREMDNESELNPPGEDDIPFLSSQGSTISTASIRTLDDGNWEREKGVKKRRFGDQDEDETHDEEDEQEVTVAAAAARRREWDSLDDDDGSISPKSRVKQIPSSFGHAFGLGEQGGQQGYLPQRRMAMPRSRSRRKGMTRLGVGALGQENADVGMDFGEAEFLDYGVLEVDMRDV